MTASLQSRYIYIVGYAMIIILLASCGPRAEDRTVTVTYRFSAEGTDCSGLSYTWMTDLGVSANCHERFTGGDFLADCPVPKTVSESLSWPDNPSSSISVSRDSTCVVSCRISTSGQDRSSDDDGYIAGCKADLSGSSSACCFFLKVALPTIPSSGPGMRGEMQTKMYYGDGWAAREGPSPGR